MLFLLGDLKSVAAHLHAAEALAEQLDDEPRFARVLNFLNSYYGLAGDPERAIEIGQRALSLGAVQNDRPLRPWGVDETLSLRWVDTFRNDKVATEAAKKQVFTAIRDLNYGRP